MVTLRRPTVDDKYSVESMVHEFEAEKSAHDGGFWQEGMFDFHQWLESCTLAEDNPQPGFVPAIQYVSFNDSGEAIGFLNLRLELNDYLLNYGGHIGYSIRPGKRGRGYAKEQLKQGLEKAYSRGIERVLVTCDETNAASRSVITANRGVLEDVREGHERYWIEKETSLIY